MGIKLGLVQRRAFNVWYTGFRMGAVSRTICPVRRLGEHQSSSLFRKKSDSDKTLLHAFSFIVSSSVLRILATLKSAYICSSEQTEKARQRLQKTTVKSNSVQPEIGNILRSFHIPAHDPIPLKSFSHTLPHILSFLTSVQHSRQCRFLSTRDGNYTVQLVFATYQPSETYDHKPP